MNSSPKDPVISSFLERLKRKNFFLFKKHFARVQLHTFLLPIISMQKLYIS